MAGSRSTYHRYIQSGITLPNWVVWILLVFILTIPGKSAFSQDGFNGSDRDSTQPGILEEVVVSASRNREGLIPSPVSIRLADSSFLRRSSAPSFFDALEHLQGVQMITPSMGFRIINTRGFANTTNVRFAQLVDGMDVQSPHIGGPIGNALGPGDLDVEKVELLPGVASALYGMNTINGLADLITKDPFHSTGLSIQQKTAITHLGDSRSAASLYSETSLRWAYKINERIAFKVNGSFTRGKDWVADDRTDLNPLANSSTGLLGSENPAQDPVNTYGNESSDRKTMTLKGKTYVVARTGYAEKDLTDHGIHNLRVDGGLYYKVSKKGLLSLHYRGAMLSNVYQRANRFMLKDYLLHQEGIQFHSDVVQAKVYINSENSGDSYNLRSMGENIDRTWKLDTKWYADYSRGYNSAYGNGMTVADAHRYARNQADSGRLQPGTEAFYRSLSKLQQINNWDSGAALKVQAAFVQAEVQYDLTESFLNGLKKKTGLEVMAGIDHRTYFIHPDGNYFINPLPGKGSQDIRYGKTGGFLSFARDFAGKKLRLGAILRGDKNDYFPILFNPRFTLVYTPSRMHSIRMSFQSGYRYPSVFEAYSNVNSGGVKRVGGLPVMSNGIFENAWLQTSISAFQSAIIKDINQGGLSKNAAIDKNKGMLSKNPYTYIKPEQANAIEVGYRGVFNNGRLFVDVDGYYSRYRNFIAQANMNVPKTTISDSIPYYLYDNSKQNKYRMWTNSRTSISIYGFSAGVRYDFGKGTLAFVNGTFSKLSRSSDEDGLEDGFNTPAWMLNAGIANPHLIGRLGAGINLHWQSGFYWQSFLVNGNVPSYATVDAHVSFDFPGLKTGVKLGASNLFNRYYTSFLGGPSIGGFYYLTLRYGLP